MQTQIRLPEGWEVRKLGDMAKIIMGQSPPSKTYNSEGKGLPFFQGKAEFGDMHPTPKKWCSEPKKVANKNDILISVRAPVGPVNLSDSKCCIGRGLCAIRTKLDKLNYNYLYNFLKSQEDILSKKERVLLTKPTEEVQIAQKYFDADFNHGLFEILRSLRKELADAEDMPPYIIFHDSSLKVMATQFPRSLSDFRKINGVGESKLEK